jgi:hypothetical protein
LTSQKRGLNMWTISSNLYFRCADVFVPVLMELYITRSSKVILKIFREKGRKPLKQKLPTNT